MCAGRLSDAKHFIKHKSILLHAVETVFIALSLGMQPYLLLFSSFLQGLVQLENNDQRGAAATLGFQKLSQLLLVDDVVAPSEATVPTCLGVPPRLVNSLVFLLLISKLQPNGESISVEMAMSTSPSAHLDD